MAVPRPIKAGGRLAAQGMGSGAMKIPEWDIIWMEFGVIPIYSKALSSPSSQQVEGRSQSFIVAAVGFP